MGFSTVFASIAFIFIFLAGILYVSVFQRTVTLTAHAQNQQADQALKTAGEQLSITDSAYLGATTVAWVSDLYVEFSGGDTAGGTAVAGEGSVVIASAPYSSSTYESEIFDAGQASSNFSTISWTSVEPALTDIAFQVRSGASIAGIQAATYTGPDGTAGTYYTVSGGTLNDSLSNNRFVQYEAFLNTADAGETPTLQRVEIGIRRPVGVTALNITNTGTEKLDWNATDFYVGGVRLLRNQTVRTTHLNDVAGQALWEPGEVLEVNIFQTLTGATQVTAANDAASDAVVVS